MLFFGFEKTPFNSENHEIIILGAYRIDFGEINRRCGGFWRWEGFLLWEYHSYDRGGGGLLGMYICVGNCFCQNKPKICVLNIRNSKFSGFLIVKNNLLQLQIPRPGFRVVGFLFIRRICSNTVQFDSSTLSILRLSFIDLKIS